MKTVIGISLGASAQDFEFNTTFLGKRLHVKRLGTNGSLAKATRLIKYWDQRATAIGLGMVKESYKAGGHAFVENDTADLVGTAVNAPITTGGPLGDILQEWALRHAQVTLGSYFNNARVLFFSGLKNHKLALSMAEYTDNLRFADPRHRCLSCWAPWTRFNLCQRHYVNDQYPHRCPLVRQGGTHPAAKSRESSWSWHRFMN
jgi:hypothetical protein